MSKCALAELAGRDVDVDAAAFSGFCPPYQRCKDAGREQGGALMIDRGNTDRPRAIFLGVGDGRQSRQRLYQEVLSRPIDVGSAPKPEAVA